MYRAKHIRDLVDLSLSSVRVANLLDEEDVLLRDNNCVYYKESAIQKVKDKIDNYKTIMENIEKVYLYYGRSKRQKEPDIYVYIGLVSYLSSVGFVRGEICYLLNKGHGSVYKIHSKLDEYMLDRIGSIIIKDVITQGKRIINV